MFYLKQGQQPDFERATRILTCQLDRGLPLMPAYRDEIASYDKTARLCADTLRNRYGLSDFSYGRGFAERIESVLSPEEVSTWPRHRLGFLAVNRRAAKEMVAKGSRFAGDYLSWLNANNLSRGLHDVFGRYAFDGAIAPGKNEVFLQDNSMLSYRYKLSHTPGKNLGNTATRKFSKRRLSL